MTLLLWSRFLILALLVGLAMWLVRAAATESE
jgi:hypothetical protein